MNRLQLLLWQLKRSEPFFSSCQTIIKTSRCLTVSAQAAPSETRVSTDTKLSSASLEISPLTSKAPPTVNTNVSTSPRALTVAEMAEIPTMAPDSHTAPSFMNDPLALKFVNCMMRDGKKSVAQRIFREALETVKATQLKKLHSDDSETTGVETDPMLVFHKALENATPILGTKPIKRGGRTYQIPIPLHPNRRSFLSMKWLITAARERPGPRRTAKMPQRLAAELIDAYNNQGTAVKKKQDMNRLAEANRAFAHFRW